MRPAAVARAGRLLATALALGLLGVGGAPTPSRAEAAPAEPEGWAYTLANELMSPYCPGRTLAECPSPQAADLRMWIIAQEAAGASREEVETLLYERFGDEIRSTPRPEGWGLAAYVIPVLAFLAGGAIVLLFLRHVRGGASPARARPADASAGTPAPLDAELERRIDEEMARSGG